MGSAVASGIAAVFICTGVYFLIGNAMFNLLKANHPDTLPEQLAGSSMIMMMVPRSLGGLLGVGAIIFACTVGCRGSARRGRGVIFAVVAVGSIALLQFAPGPWILAVPAFLLGVLTESSLGSYVGAILQLLVGIWLLGFFGQRRYHNETQAV